MFWAEPVCSLHLREEEPGKGNPRTCPDGIQVPVEVLLKSELSSWTIPPEALSATSRAQVRTFQFSQYAATSYGKYRETAVQHD